MTIVVAVETAVAVAGPGAVGGYDDRRGGDRGAAHLRRWAIVLRPRWAIVLRPGAS